MSEVKEVVKKEVPAFPLQDLLPDDLSELFRYSGSLTTPPCSQIVEVRGRPETSVRLRGKY